MNLKYNKDDDILMVELNKEPIDYAEQSGDLIVHFSPNKKAVLLEILDASVFLKEAAKSLPAKVMRDIMPQPSIAHRVK